MQSDRSIQESPRLYNDKDDDAKDKIAKLWWNTNVPPELHTENCPSYLTYALDDRKDKFILSTRDEDYPLASWSEVQEIVRENRLDRFTRVPSQLRAYRLFCAQVEVRFSSVFHFMLEWRLGWDFQYGDAALDFDNFDNWKILRNDWPYGFDPRIVHLVVWTKFALPADPSSEKGDMSPATKAIVEQFVQENFADVKEKVWFKNWNALKSIHSVEHFHVLLFEPKDGFVESIIAPSRHY